MAKLKAYKSQRKTNQTWKQASTKPQKHLKNESPEITTYTKQDSKTASIKQENTAKMKPRKNIRQDTGKGQANINKKMTGKRLQNERKQT